MKLSHTMETAFGTPARIVILRRLSAVSQPLSGRQIAELAGLTHRGAIQAIAPLVEAGIVRRRQAGRAHQYTLVRKNIVVVKIILPALREEEAIPDALKDELTRMFAGDTVSLMLFGSFARGEETNASDVDALAVAGTTNKKEVIEKIAEAGAAAFREKYAAPLSVRCLTLEEIKGRKQIAFIKRVSHEGILLSGKTVEKLMCVSSN